MRLKKIVLLWLLTSVCYLSVLLGSHKISAVYNVIRVPEDYIYIQDAVNAADSGDIIEVTPSKFIRPVGHQVVIKKPITLRAIDKTSIYLNCIIESDDVIIEGFYCNYYSGIGIYGSKNCIIRDNDFKEIGVIEIGKDSDNITLINNYLIGSFDIINSKNIYMRNNIFVNASIRIFGTKFEHYIHDIDDSNIFDGKPINYFINKNDVILDSVKYPNSDQFILVNSSNVILNNFNLTARAHAIDYTKGIRIENSYASISLLFSKNVIIKNNSYISIFIKGCYNITIKDNDLVGIYSAHIVNSSKVTIYNNKIKYIMQIEIISSDNINIIKNNFTSYDTKKSHVVITQSRNGTVEQNNFIEKYIRINNSTQWRFYLNNFYNSTPYYDEGYFSHLVKFDNGYPLGNYWNTYDGTDDYSGPAINSIGEDGVGDTPFEIFSRRDEGSWFDYYPLMNPIPNICPATHPVIQSVTSSIIKPRSYEEVNITASILSYRDIDKIILSYNDGSWHNVSMSTINGNYIGIIPKQENGTLVQYKIYVMDNTGNYAVSQLFNYTVKDKTPLNIETVNWVPTEPKPDEYVEVETKIVSKDEDISVSRIILSFRDAGSKWWNTTAEYDESEDIWIAQIPKQPEKTEIQFYLIAFDNEGEHVNSEFYKYEVLAYTGMEAFQKFIGTPIGIMSIVSIILALILVFLLIRKK